MTDDAPRTAHRDAAHGTAGSDAPLDAMALAVPGAVTIPRGWAPVIAHAAVLAVTQILWLTYAPIATDAAVFYGVSSTAITALATVYPVLYFVLAIPAGRLLDLRPHPTLLAGALLTAGGALLRLVPQSYAAALAGQLLVAVAQPILFNGIVVVARTNLTEAQRPAGIAAGTIGAFAGVILGFLLPALLVDGTDLQRLLVVEAALAVATGLWMVWLLRGRMASHLADDLEVTALRAVWADPAIRGLALLSFGGFGIFATLLTVLQTLLEPRGVSADAADQMVLAMTVVGIAVSVVLPAWAARRGRERGALITASTGAACATALLALDLPELALGALLVMIGALLLPALPILLELGERRHPTGGGSVSAIVFLAGNLGVALLTVIASALDDSHALPFLALAAASLLTLAVAWRGLRLAAGSPAVT